MCPLIFFKRRFSNFSVFSWNQDSDCTFQYGLFGVCWFLGGFSVHCGKWRMNEHFRMKDARPRHSYVHLEKPWTVGVEVHPLSTTRPIVLSTPRSSFTVSLRRGEPSEALSQCLARVLYYKLDPILMAARSLVLILVLVLSTQSPGFVWPLDLLLGCKSLLNAQPQHSGCFFFFFCIRTKILGAEGSQLSAGWSWMLWLLNQTRPQVTFSIWAKTTSVFRRLVWSYQTG